MQISGRRLGIPSNRCFGDSVWLCAQPNETPNAQSTQSTWRKCYWPLCFFARYLNDFPPMYIFDEGGPVTGPPCLIAMYDGSYYLSRWPDEVTALRQCDRRPKSIRRLVDFNVFADYTHCLIYEKATVRKVLRKPCLDKKDE